MQKVDWGLFFVRFYENYQPNPRDKNMLTHCEILLMACVVDIFFTSDASATQVATSGTKKWSQCGSVLNLQSS